MSSSSGSVITTLTNNIVKFFDTIDGKKYVDEVLSGKDVVTINMDEFEDWDYDTAHSFMEDAVIYGIKALEDALKQSAHIVGTGRNIEIAFSGESVLFVKGHELGAEHIGNLVRVRGLVNQTGFIKPMAMEVVFKCRECGEYSHPIVQETPFELTKPQKKCEFCDERVQYDVVEERSIYINSQEFAIQESHEDVSGTIPQKVKMMVFKKHLINKVYCGDLVEVYGTVRLAPRYKRGRVLRFNDIYIDVYSIVKHSKDPENIEISDDEEKEILALSQEENIYDKLVDNIAPSLYGIRKCKEACLLALFSGVTKHKKDITIRGNIHVLMVGDPSTGKSQLLRTVSDLSPRGMFAIGRGTTAAGLTASLTKDEAGEWMISAGVVVLADKGVACIDEIDKMREDDRVNLHEAMAQQTVSINKATMHNTLMARTSIIAAANPLLGRYDQTKSVFENLSKFPPTLFSRFDLIFVLIDNPQAEQDMRVLKKIETEDDEGKINRSLFKKYIAYAKRYKPIISQAAKKILRDYFLSVRKQMRESGTEEKIPITYRQYEALLRMCEAHAKALLKDTADLSDAKAAINIFTKFLEDIDFDVDAVETGTPKTLRKIGAVIYDEVKRRQMLMTNGVPTHEIINIMASKGISTEKTRRVIQQLKADGVIMEYSEGHYKTTQ